MYYPLYVSNKWTEPLDKYLGDSSLTATILNNLGYLYERQGNQRLAIENYYRAMDVHEQIRNRALLDEIKSGLDEDRRDLYQRAVLLLVRSGRFHQEQSTTFLTHKLSGKLVGMVGLGDIGQEIVKRLRAFEMDVIYTKRNRLPEQRERDLGVTWEAELDDLLRKADFIVVMTTYNATTHRLAWFRSAT